MEINDPWLAELVRRADAGENLFDTVDFTQTPDTSMHHDEKIEALVEMICRSGDEPETKSAALLVLMTTLKTRCIRKRSRTRLNTWPSRAAVS